MSTAASSDTESFSLLTRMKASLQRHLDAPSSVVAGVSGGADSVALLRGLLACEAGCLSGVRLTVAHFDHGLRGEESAADADWVAELCRSLNLQCIVGTASDVSSSPVSSEESARDCRYSFLQRVAEDQQAQAILLAHTADDQAETVLHHLIRGTGLSGLRGIPETRSLTESVQLIRPILDVKRVEVEAWLVSIGQDWRVDRTNEDSRFTRNRIRHELLPLLEQEFNPQIRRVIRSLSRQAGELSDFARACAEEAAEGIVLAASEQSIRIDCAPLMDQPAVLVRETLLLVWQHAGWPLQRMGFDQWDRLAAIVSQAGAVSLPGQIDAVRRGSLLVLTRRPTS